MARHRKPKRGVVLLIILTLLTLLVVIGVTFALISGQYRRSAEEAAKSDLYGDPPAQLADRVMYQVLRDTTAKTVLFGHSLLRDLYGNDGVRGVVDLGARHPITLRMNGEWMEFGALVDPKQPFGRTLSTDFQAYTGCVLTMLDGPATGLSTRIVAYSIQPGADGRWGRSGVDDDNDGATDDISERLWNPAIMGREAPTFGLPATFVNDDIVVVRAEVFKSDRSLPVLPNSGDHFLINGHPFNGTGFGYMPEPASRNLDARTFDPGPDGGWGNAGVDDDGNGITDDWRESGWSGSDDVAHPTALLPNFGMYPIPTRVAANVGGADESYDAPDYQNMMLAMVPPAAANPSQIIPSLHRPALVNYWVNQPASSWLPANNPNWRDFRRQIVFRPMPWDHPNFTGGNPAFVGDWSPGPDGRWGRSGVDDDQNGTVDDWTEKGANGSDDVLLNDLALTQALINDPTNPIHATWDVDNDGDGITDSIWIDPGLPIRTSPDGHRYKPLVAILCKDLDGRLNLNAHGQLVQMDPATFGPTPPSIYTAFNAAAGIFNLLPVAGIFAGGANPVLPRGLGVGPAEIHLGAAFFGTPQAGLEANRLIQMRNGLDRIFPGRNNAIDDPLSAIKNPGLPDNYYALQFSSYGTQPDTRGLGAVGLDPLGQPFRVYMGQNHETLNDPYEFLLAQNGDGDEGPRDIPFTVAELERLLRFNDIDVQGLPSRLAGVAPNTFAARQRRELVTTLSSYIPAPTGFAPQLFRTPGAGPEALIGNWTPGRDHRWGVAGVDDDQNGTPDDASERGWPGSDDVVDMPNLVGLYHAKLRAAGVPEGRVPIEINKLIPFELAHGERLNINRLLGNGIDDNGNQVVDEFLESAAGQPAWTAPTVPAPFRSVAYSPRNNDPIAVADSRQILARHLYCLLMLLADQRYIQPVTEAGLSQAQRRELTARRLAQWAINAIDFRDSDAIMTPFEYDINPFDGWCTDGDLGARPSFGPDGAWGRAGVDDNGNGLVDDLGERGWSGSDDTDDRTNAQRRVVWGCEYPDLLLTETFAFHDRRVKDTDLDSTGRKLTDTNNADDDMDQYRIPQGSLYLEFYCTRNRNENNPIVPRELYNINTGNGETFLDLARMAPASNPSVGSRRVPVWRVGISRSHHAGAPGGPIESPLQRRVNKPDTTSFDPANMSVFPPAPAAPPNPQDVLDLERFVWFTSIDPATLGLPLNEAQRIYWNRSGAARAQVKPSSYAVVGPRLETFVGSRIPVTPNDPPDYLPGNQRIELTPTGVQVFQVDNTDRTPATAPSANALILPAQTMVCAADPPTDASLPLPWSNVRDTAPMGIGISVTEPVPLDHYYREPTSPLSAANGFPYDAYHDFDNVTGFLPDAPFDSRPNRPLKEDSILDTDTTLDYKTAFLQRLADPTLPWNPEPYLPDGVTPNPEHDPHFPVNKYITVDWMPIDVTVFNGEDNSSLDPDDPSPAAPAFETRERGPANFDLWSVDTQPPSTSPVLNTPAPDQPYFDFNMIQSLGYLNQTYGPAAPNIHPVGATLTAATAPQPEYIGAPLTPFPWLTWNNRPYATPLELMMVPASSPARLTHEHSLNAAANLYARTQLYLFRSTDSPPRDTPTYLLNFFATDPATNQAAHLYALFDYVGMPSPYVGTDRWFNPLAAAASGVEADTYRPPFNRLSRFRDPGRVNINTIFDMHIFEGIMKGFPFMDPTLNPGVVQALMLTRQGYGGTLYGLDPTYPTRFAIPFRAAGDAGLDPIPAHRQVGVEATLLRKSPTGPNPLLNYQSTNATNNTLRNPAFRFQGLERLGNMLSTNSNAYAVWLTLGYFEVEPNPGSPASPTGVDSAHPDGFRLGQELGTDTGTIKRHRAFYIIDRSIPVGFEPGENHNVDRAVLLRRMIE